MCVVQIQLQRETNVCRKSGQTQGNLPRNLTLESCESLSHEAGSYGKIAFQYVLRGLFECDCGDRKRNVSSSVLEIHLISDHDGPSTKFRGDGLQAINVLHRCP